MKANELMIGDWVKVTDDDTDDSFIGQVKAIDELENINVQEGEDVAYPYSIDCLEPIPLTPEILEKNGFTKDKEIDQWYFKSDDRLDMGLLAVGIDDGCGIGFCVIRNGAITYYCKYVHELQHYLRLIGGAKEIEL